MGCTGSTAAANASKPKKGQQQVFSPSLEKTLASPSLQQKPAEDGKVLKAKNATPNGYAIAAFVVKNPKFLTEFEAKVCLTCEPFGGSYVVRSPASKAAYSETSTGYSVVNCIEFPSLDVAKQWAGSEAYQALVPALKEFAETKTMLLIEGPSQHAVAEAGVSKGYVFGELKVKDPKFKPEYAGKVEFTLAPFGGGFLVRTPVEQAAYREGADYTIFVLIEFPSLGKALAWQKSDAYQAIFPAKNAYADTVSFMIFESESRPIVNQ